MRLGMVIDLHMRWHEAASVLHKAAMRACWLDGRVVS
jgi:hypothetical protein